MGKQFRSLAVSDSLWPHGLQHTRLPCPSPTPGVYSDSCLLSQWWHPTISSSVIPFSSCLQSFPASGSFQMSQFFSAQLSSQSNSHIHTWLTTGKTIALTRWTFISKVMSLFFNMLSRLVITFLPRSKCLSWARRLQGQWAKEGRWDKKKQQTPRLGARLSVQWVLGGWERAGTDPPDCKGFEHWGSEGAGVFWQFGGCHL